MHAVDKACFWVILYILAIVFLVSSLVSCSTPKPEEFLLAPANTEIHSSIRPVSMAENPKVIVCYNKSPLLFSTAFLEFEQDYWYTNMMEYWYVENLPSRFVFDYYPYWRNYEEGR